MSPQATLPPGIVAVVLAGDGDAAVAQLGREVQTPEIVWDRTMRAAAAARVSELAREARARQVI